MRAALAAAALALVLIGPAPARGDPQTHDPKQVPAGDYVVDPKHASLIVRVLHMGFSRYTMRFRTISGGFTYDPANWQATKATIVIDPRSIDTEDAGFNKTIAGYFEPDTYREIRFVSTGLTETAEGRGQLTGDLTFHGVTHPVTLDVTFNGAGPGLLGGGTRLGFSGSGRIRRSDFKVAVVRNFVGDDVDLELEVEFYRK